MVQTLHIRLGPTLTVERHGARVTLTTSLRDETFAVSMSGAEAFDLAAMLDKAAGPQA